LSVLSETVTHVDFAAFYRAEVDSLVRFVMFLGCGGGDTAEDIAQTALERAFTNWETIRLPRAWLRKVAEREYIRLSRAAARETSLGPHVRRAEHRAAVSAALTLQQQAETRDVLAAVIADLPPKQRQVMAWCWDGFSDEEIARELGCSEVAVRKNRSRAMKTLRRALGDMERGTT
jgi:RNA polymerase sigma factor (sigma-70 family)